MLLENEYSLDQIPLIEFIIQKLGLEFISQYGSFMTVEYISKKYFGISSLGFRCIESDWFKILMNMDVYKDLCYAHSDFTTNPDQYQLVLVYREYSDKVVSVVEFTFSRGPTTFTLNVQLGELLDIFKADFRGIKINKILDE